jgi:histidinol dehydrogenase
MEFVAAPARLSTADAQFEHDFAQRLHWSADTDAAIEQRVADILADVQQRGDAAVLEYTARFDGLQADSMAALELTKQELKAAFDSLPAAEREALESAARRAQLPRGAEEGQWRELELPRRRRHAAGPEGHAAGPRGHLRARRQGGLSVQRADERHSRPCGRCAGHHHGRAHAPGQKNPLVLAAAYVAGVHRAFTIGGAQAVAALAYGTATVPKVDKITGPGNAYVASAKKRVFGIVGIDMIAGPSKSWCWPTARPRPTGWPWTCSARPSTTSWPSPSCCAPMPPISMPSRPRSTACCPRCRARPSSPRA